jgi:hypothetical protein
MNVQPKYRRPLNNHQVAILNTLYKFRFTTVALLAENQNANNLRVISNRLKILADQGYIGMNYDSSYKIKGQPATYYLQTDGTRYLRTQDYTNESALRSIYHDKRAKPSQIAHRLHVFKVYVQLKNQFPGRFKFYSKTELLTKDYVPKTKPDALLIDAETNQHHFMDYLEDTVSFWTLRKTIRRYITYAELGIWQKQKSGTPHPNILLICESPRLKKRVKTLVNRELDSSYVDLDVHVKQLEDLNLP